VNTAILSGDVMLVKVYELFARLKPQLLRQVLEAFNACATEVCEGQQWDMEFETRSTVTEKEYIHMIRQKTAVLLGFSLELGALLAEAPEADRKALRNLGISIGIGFQLTDDLLDAYADPKKFGKQVGGDIVANKKTYLLIKAWQLATPQQRKTLHHWLTAKSPDKKEKVREVKKIFDALDLEKITQRKSQSYFQKGLTQLNHLHIPDLQRESLRSYIRELIHRQV
jgi:geranylgeranyl diphosphate synthase type II